MIPEYMIALHSTLTSRDDVPEEEFSVILPKCQSIDRFKLTTRAKRPESIPTSY